ncbi:MAG: rpfC 3 [Phycisphaerales bacterium]|nr:rpfC 3 [Phycisphaerales bacterium]
MNRVSARSRIAIGQVLLLVSVLWLAIALGIVPSERSAIMSGRAKLCEAIAINSSAFLEHNDVPALKAALRAVAERDSDILAARVLNKNGAVLTEIGDRAAAEKTYGKASLDSDIFVPIYANDRKWGTVDIRFRPISKLAIFGQIQVAHLRMVAFIAAVCMGLFLIYLRKMLQHLDPSKVVPSRVRSALDTLAEGLLVMDADERIVLANQAFATIVGRKPDDLLGARASQIPWIQEAGEAATVQPWSTALRDGAAQKGVMLRLKDAHSARRTFSVNCSPVLGQDGAHRGVLASFDDVTLLEEKEVELRRSKDAAESANRAKSEFLARMSHEIRTPMNAILGFAEVLRRGYEESEADRQEYLDTIHSSGQHLLELINDILDLSKIEAGRLEIERSRCSPHQVLSEVVAVLSIRARQKELTLDFKWDGPAPETIETDPTRFRQVLTNLVGNAIKFTETGSVRLVARLLPAGDTPMLAVDVIDTGIGLKPESLSRIFQPFAQADTSITRRFGGTGLGLSISQQIASALGGELSVNSEYGKGSVFTLKIMTGPLVGVRIAEPQAIASAAPAKQHDVGPGFQLTGTHVLLVEDGVSNRKLISLVLQRAGATLESAADGREGVEAALRGGFDVILMDMQMPVMDGYTAVRLLRDKGVMTPIIALTAHAMQGDEEKCRAAGCSGFLTKPIDVDRLVRTVAEAGGPTGAGAGITLSARVAPPAVPATQDSPIAPAKSLIQVGFPAPLQSTLPVDDPEFCEIVVEFIDRLGEQLTAMQDAWGKQDLSELASLAHWLKGSGGTAGFPALTDPARKLEELAREQRLDEIGGQISALRELADRIEAPSQSDVQTA